MATSASASPLGRTCVTKYDRNRRRFPPNRSMPSFRRFTKLQHDSVRHVAQISCLNINPTIHDPTEVPILGLVGASSCFHPWIMPRTRVIPRGKLRGAAMLSDHAWLEIAAALDITRREQQIIQAVFDNLTEARIAERFKLSPHTIHMHMNRLFKKLGVSSRTELVLRIVEQMILLTLSETAVLPPICPRHHAGDCCRHIPTLPPAKP
jgi:DNA-binding CsgD family transcriptional regulator